MSNQWKRRRLRILEKKESNYLKKKKLITSKKPIAGTKTYYPCNKISFNVYSAVVVFDIFLFFAVFKPCFREKKYKNHTEMRLTFQPKRYIIRKTYNLIFVRILQVQANTWQNPKKKIKKKSCRQMDKKKLCLRER